MTENHVFESTDNELKAEVIALRQQVKDLEQDKFCLQTLLQTTTEHSENVKEQLNDKAEAALRASERRLRMIIEATPIAVVVTELSSSIIVFVNAIAGPLAGSTCQDIVGHKMTDFYVNPSERTVLVELLSKEGQVDHKEVQFIRKDGVKFWVDISMRYIEFDGKPCILAAWNDISHLKELNKAARRFVPREYLSFLNKESLADIHLGDHVTDEMTVMFSDLRSFTRISEDMTPQQNFDFVNAYLGRVSPMVRENGGFIVKYLGDGIMAIFPGDADSGVQAGIDKISRVNNYNVERIEQSRLPIEIGIGVNTGHMMVGMVGETGRMQGDAFSDDVNLTSRVEGLTKYYGVSFIITAATKNALVDSSQYHIRFLDKVQVKGKQKPLTLYEIYDADLPYPRSLKKATHQAYEMAMKLFYAKEFSQAQMILLDVLKENPKDKVAWRHLMKVTECLENGVHENWTGTTIMTTK